MSILDVTEDQIFQTLGRGKDPNFKPIEKVRPAVPRPKKTDNINQTIKQTIKPNQPQAVKAFEEYAKPAPSPVIDESMKRLEEELCELNNRVSGVQKMVKWYVLPQFIVILILLLALFIRS